MLKYGGFKFVADAASVRLQTHATHLTPTLAASATMVRTWNLSFAI